MNNNFISASQVCLSLVSANMYLAVRQEDSKRLDQAMQRVTQTNGKLALVFENRYKVYFYPNGDIWLVDPDAVDGKMFATIEQFKAYYLAKFW